MSTIRLGALGALLLLMAAPGVTLAQDARLAGRLDASTLAAVDREVAAARADRLPVEPLVQKALEGAALGAPGGRIVSAVRGLRERLGVAREALGSGASASELVAGAGALYVDVPPEALRRIKEGVGEAATDLPLVVLADLVQRGVPVEAAVGSVESLGQAGARAEGYHLLRYRVEADIQNGTLPAIAAERQSSRILRELRGGIRPPGGLHPPGDVRLPGGA